PVDGTDETLGEQPDVEAQLPRAGVDRLLLGGEQIDEERPQAALLQLLGDEAVPRAVAAGAAPVREEHHALSLRGERERALERNSVACGDARLPRDAASDFGHCSVLRLAVPPRQCLCPKPFAPARSRGSSRAARASRSCTSSSLVCEKSSYQSPTA